jgi:hypothetical protein
MSEEHYLPDGLGRFVNYERLLDKVCADCNREIGKAEESFLRTGYIAALRRQLGIKGKDGLPPNPYERGASGVPRLKAPLKGQAFEFEVLFECDPGTKTGRPLRQIIFQDQFQKTQPLFIPEWTLSAPAEFGKLILSAGLDKATPIHGFAHTADIDHIKVLLESNGIRPPTKWNWEGNEFEPHWERVTVEAAIPWDPFTRSIAKIAFHYTLKMFPSLSGHEPELKPIIDFIWKGGDNRFVTQNFAPAWIPKYWSHFLTVARSYYQGIRATVHLFVPPPGELAYLPPLFTIFVGTDPSRIVMPIKRCAHQFVMSQLQSPSGPIGEMVDLLKT